MTEAEIRAAQAAKLDELRSRGRPLELTELKAARNKGVRLMVDRFPDMRPQEIIGAIAVLDAEIAAREVHPEAPAEKDEFTREKALEALRGRG